MNDQWLHIPLFLTFLTLWYDLKRAMCTACTSWISNVFTYGWMDEKRHRSPWSRTSTQTFVTRLMSLVWTFDKVIYRLGIFRSSLLLHVLLLDYWVLGSMLATSHIIPIFAQRYQDVHTCCTMFSLLYSPCCFDINPATNTDFQTTNELWFTASLKSAFVMITPSAFSTEQENIP